MGRILQALGWVSFLFNTSQSYGFTHSVTPSGTPVSWKDGRFILSGTPGNRSGLADSTIFASFARGVQRWSHSTDGSLSFDYWQGNNPRMYEPNSEFNGLSSIYFSSKRNTGGSALDTNVIGVTQLWYDPSNGAIREADIELNDVSYTFSDSPTDTTGTGNGAMSGSRRLFLDNVVTHEIGHALGLSHAGNMHATMLFVEAPEQAFLSCDDHAGIRQIYGGSGATGFLAGRVLNPQGGALLGAQVVAISVAQGKVVSSALTGYDGSYNIAGLPAGNYTVMVEPFRGGAGSLPIFFAPMNHRMCSGRLFSRTFMKSSANEMETFFVSAGTTASAGDVTVACGTESGADVPSTLGNTTRAQAPVVFANNENAAAFVDRAQGNAVYYRLENVQGHFEINVLSHSLYSPTVAYGDIFDANGNAVTTTTEYPSYTGSSGFRSYDERITANLARGTYYLRVRTQSMPSAYYPGSQAQLDSNSFYVVTMAQNSTADGIYADNKRCIETESFAAYQSPPGFPPRRNIDGSDSTVGFCGTIDSGKGPGATPGQIVGWFLPYLMIAAMGFQLRSRRRVVNLLS